MRQDKIIHMVKSRFKYMGYFPITEEYNDFVDFAKLNHLSFVESDTFVFFNSELLYVFIAGLDIAESRILNYEL